MKVVLQEGIKDCGISCLLSIIKYYQGDVSREYLREITNTTRSGVTAYKLVEASKKLGFSASGVAGNLENIKKSDLPVIAHIIKNKSYYHFIVIYEIDFNLNKMLIMDPAFGKKIIKIAEFKLLSSNNYIFLKPIKKLPLITRKKIITKTITKYMRKNKIFIFYILLLTIIYFIFNVISAFHFKYLLDFAITYNIDHNIKIISIIMIVIYLIKEFSNIIKNILLLKLTTFFDYFLTIKTYERIILLPYLYYKNRTTGEVIAKIKDIGIVKNFLAKLIMILLTDLLC